MFVFHFWNLLKKNIPFLSIKKEDKKEKCQAWFLSPHIISIRDPFIEIAQQIHLANSMSYPSKNSFFSVLD